ncbi:MAG: hemolysin family protein [Acidimicrobiia bacterium]|nr:hemolysin family protein [Acidimicrobiia bacterium]
MTALALVASVLMLAVNGFFVAVEFALLGSRRPRLEAQADDGRRARRALASMGDLSRQIGGAQLGITIASLVLGFLAEPALAVLIEDAVGFAELPSGLLHTISFVVALTIVTTLHMVIGEMVPKNVAIAEPERSLLVLAGPHHLFVELMRPLIWLVNVSAVVIVKALGFEITDEIRSAHTAEEFHVIVRTALDEGQIEEFDHNLLSGALEFGERTVAAVMVPYDEVVSVSRQMTLAEVEAVLVSSGHSRLPVLGAGVDDVLGYVHAKDLLRIGADGHDEPVPLETIRRMLKVPSTSKIEDLLLQMRQSRLHFAVVHDAARRTVGIVTLEDVLEELVGEIADESDR